MLVLFVLVFFGSLSQAALFDSQCPNPPAAENFNLQKYSGLWFQMAKIQTAGGAFFQKNCTCTEIFIDQKTKPGSTFAIQSCIKNSKNVTVNATLLPTDINGKFIEQISFNKVLYYVIQLDDNTAIEFDCQVSLGIRNYCIHIMSRKRSLDKQRLNQLVNFALSLGLNPQNLQLTITDQQNCPKGSMNFKTSEH